nr:Tox-REase-5 domain-containing protein [Myxococcus sp. AM011]
MPRVGAQRADPAARGARGVEGRDLPCGPVRTGRLLLGQGRCLPRAERAAGGDRGRRLRGRPRRCGLLEPHAGRCRRGVRRVGDGGGTGLLHVPDRQPGGVEADAGCRGGTPGLITRIHGALPVHDARRAVTGRLQAGDEPHRHLGYGVCRDPHSARRDVRHGRGAGAVAVRSGRARHGACHGAGGTCGGSAEWRAWSSHHPSASEHGNEGVFAVEGTRTVGTRQRIHVPRARRYQEQITGHSADEAYWVGGVGRDSGGVKFDGFEKGALQEAKGPGYANKFLDNLKPRIWFENSGAKALVEQAQRQLAKAPSGVPIKWFIAEEKTAEAIRVLFQRERVLGIEVLYVPPL